MIQLPYPHPRLLEKLTAHLQKVKMLTLQVMKKRTSVLVDRLGLVHYGDELLCTTFQSHPLAQ
jgi:hypothetical protein